MKSYTLYDLGMNVSGEKFLLPFDVDEKDETILEKTVKIISDAEIYERCLFTDRDKNDQIKVNEWGYIEMKCLYEGNDDYYPFTMLMEVFRFNSKQEKPKYDPSSHSFDYLYEMSKWKPITIYSDDENGKTEVKDGQWMVALRIEHSENGLLDELIDLRVMPTVIEKLNFKKYSYK